MCVSLFSVKVYIMYKNCQKGVIICYKQHVVFAYSFTLMLERVINIKMSNSNVIHVKETVAFISDFVYYYQSSSCCFFLFYV